MTKPTGSASSGALPVLLRRMNERRVIDSLARHGSMSRADLARHTGISAPTVSKAVDSLVSLGLVERHKRHGNRTGRPAPLYALAAESVHVIGVSVRPDACRIVSSGVDCRGEHRDADHWPTPHKPNAIADAIAQRVAAIDDATPRRLLGVGVCTPGVVDPQLSRVTDSHAIPALAGADLADLIAHRCSHALRLVDQVTGICLAERWFDTDSPADHFVVIDTTDAIVARLYSRGRALLSPRGLGGAIGRLPIHPDDRDADSDGRLLTLDDVATDAAFAHAISARVGRTLDPAEAAVVAAGHLFDPDAVFLHGSPLDAADDLIDRVAAHAAERAEPRPLRRCSARLIHAPLAAIVDHLTHCGEPHA